MVMSLKANLMLLDRTLQSQRGYLDVAPAAACFHWRLSNTGLKYCLVCDFTTSLVLPQWHTHIARMYSVAIMDKNANIAIVAKRVQYWKSSRWIQSLLDYIYTRRRPAAWSKCIATLYI